MHRGLPFPLGVCDEVGTALGNEDRFGPCWPVIHKDHLPVCPIEADAVDAVLLGVHPVHVVGLHIHGEACGVADAAGDQGDPVAAIKVGAHNLGELAVVEPVDELLDRVHRDLPRAVRGGGVNHLPVSAVQPGDLGNARLVKLMSSIFANHLPQ